MAHKILKLTKEPGTKGGFKRMSEFGSREKEPHTGQRIREFIEGYSRMVLAVSKAAASSPERARDILVNDFLTDIPWEETGGKVDMREAGCKLEKSAKQASRFIREINDQFVPEGEGLDEMEPVAQNNDVVSLISRVREMWELMREKKAGGQGADPCLQREYFETVRKLALAKDFLEIDFTEGGANALRKDQLAMESAMERSGMFAMEDGRIKEEEKKIFAYIDRDTNVCKYAFVEDEREVPGGYPDLLRRVIFKARIRHLERGGERTEKQRPVILQMRIKEPVSHESKMIREGLHSPGEVLDYRGMRFITINKDGRGDLAENAATKKVVKKSLFPSPGTARKVRYAQDARPAKSSDKLRIDAEKDRFRGKEWELQVQGLNNYITSLMVDNEKINHDLYRLGQHLEATFPDIFPQHIYGVDWSDDRTKKRYEKAVQARIKSRLREEVVGEEPVLEM